MDQYTPSLEFIELVVRTAPILPVPGGKRNGCFLRRSLHHRNLCFPKAMDQVQAVIEFHMDGTVITAMTTS